MKNRFFKYISNHKVIFSIAGVSIIASAAIIPTTVILTKKEPQLLLFDNKTFDNKQALQNFINQNTKVTHFNSHDINYIWDGKVFDSIKSATEAIDAKYPITPLFVKRDPNTNNYIKSADGSLSETILDDSDKEIVKVYRTKHNIPTFDYDEALNSYLNANSSIEYKVFGKHFASFEDAKKYNNEVFRTDLENTNKTIYQTVYDYILDGRTYSKEEIIDKLKEGIYRGFIYEGEEYLETEKEKFINYFSQKMTESFKDKYIKKINNPNLKSYFITLESLPNGAYFSSPKYVETVETITSNPVFKETGSKPVSIFMPASLNIMGPLIGLFASNSWKNKRNSISGGATSMEAILSELKDNNGLGQKEYKEFMELYDMYTNEHVKEDLFIRLADIRDEEFTDLHRLLIAFKRLNTYLKMYSTDNLGPDFHLKLISKMRQLVLSIIQNTSIEFLAKLTKTNPKITFAIFQKMSFEEIYNVFINPSYFSRTKAGLENKMFYDLLFITQQAMEDVINLHSPLSTLANAAAQTILSFDEEVPGAASDTRIINGLMDEVNNVILDIAGQGAGILDGLGVEAAGPVGMAIGIIKLVQKVWELGYYFSFSELVNMEYKIDNFQKMIYSNMVYKIPLLNVRVTDPGRPVVKVDLLNDSILKYMTGTASGENAVYEFRGKRYLNKDNAVKDLVNDVYLKPEKYLATKSFLKHNNFNNLEPYLLFQDVEGPIIVGDDDDPNATISEEDYENEITKEKEEYSKKIFEYQYGTNNLARKKAYLDGAGNSFPTKELLMDSVNKKMNNKEEYQYSYVYTARNGAKYYKKKAANIKKIAQEKEIIDSKDVFESDLILKENYDDLPEYKGDHFEIYQINFYGERKLFYSQKLAQNYIYNNVQIKEHRVLQNYVEYNYDNVIFDSKTKFDYWVDNNTMRISKNQKDKIQNALIKKEDDLYA